MDKYTVDLDKVLNDFEYSELTDQHVRPNSYNNNNNNNNRVNNKDVTKHSINNVFHSLNEYLSTDVGDGSDVIVAADNNCKKEEEEEEVKETTINVPVVDLLIGDEDAKEIVEETEVKVVGDEEELVEEECVAVIVNDVEQIVEIGEESEVLLKKEEQEEEEEKELKIPEEVVIKEEIVKTESAINEIEQESAIIGFNQPVELEEGELDKYLEELEEEEKVEEEGEKEEKIKEEKDDNEEKAEDLEDKSSLTRPDSLPLDNVEQKKDINLIGEPGSTPYNNVYVTKELLPPDNNNKMHEEEIEEESSSPSPTFSDESHDSSGSTTPSTETLNDDDDDDDDEVVGVAATTAENNSNRVHPVSVELEVANEEREERQEVEEEEQGAALVVNPERREEREEEQQQPREGVSWLGKQAPLWIPDAEAMNCMHCDMKFTVIKRRHHCRACGLVLCSKCCYLKRKLEYLDAEARVCNKCYELLQSTDESPQHLQQQQQQQPNPNNPMEYCSMVPPLQQVMSGGASAQNHPPTVMVPVGVLKRSGSAKKSNKSVMFCDGIRPGSDLTNLDTDFNYDGTLKKSSTVAVAAAAAAASVKHLPVFDADTKSFIPAHENSLPPTVTFYKSDISYSECGNNSNVVEMLQNEILTFALQKNLYVLVKIINMNCCINKLAWCFSTEGLINVGQDEIVILLEFIDGEKTVPKDVFHHINNIYSDALRGVTVKELGISLHNHSNLLDSKNHSGFLYIRPTFQCLTNVIIPKEQYLIGILIHRWETPWAKIFPLRLILRLGAEYRYYPSPIISTRHRESVYFEIGHTIIKLLADFRNYSYTLQQIRGLTIHMEDKNTTVNIPINRYDQVMKAINNSSDHILAFGACFSPKADSHLVCIQDANSSGENSSYNTHAINIQNKPRKVTGASFIVFNGALKSTSGLTAKSSIVEDGLMIQIPADNMEKVRECLKNMKNHTIQCGCVNAESDETVSIIWCEADTNFNVGVESVIDKQSLSSTASIRVHNGKDYVCNSGNHLIRWSEVFIVQNCEENSKNQDAVNISKVSESIAKAVCQALVKYLDLLASNHFHKIGIRVTLHVDNVSYCAGSNNMKLPPIYMKSLDNELVPVLHRITTNSLGENTVILELVFRILNV